MSSEWHASKHPHIFILPKLTFPCLLSNLVPVILLIQLLWQTGSYSDGVRRWTRSVVLMHQFTPLFIHSQASEQDPSKLLSHKKAFLWKLLFSTSCTMDKCRWLVWWLVQHCSTLTLFKTGWFIFFPSYTSRSQDFLRVQTTESFTWFISTMW